MWHFKFKERWLRRVKHYNKLLEHYNITDPLKEFEDKLLITETKTGGVEETSSGTSTTEGETETSQTQRDTPISAYDESDFVSFKGDEKSVSSGSQISQINNVKDLEEVLNREEVRTTLTETELKKLNDFVTGYKDLLDEMIKEFRDLFMYIY